MIALGAAVRALEKGVAVVAADGRKVVFDNALVRKYVGGERKGGEAPERLKHLPRAIQAVMKANQGVNNHPWDSPPQTTFYHGLGGNRGTIVFIDSATGKVRGFIYGKDKYLVRKHTRQGHSELK